MTTTTEPTLEYAAGCEPVPAPEDEIPPGLRPKDWRPGDPPNREELAARTERGDDFPPSYHAKHASPPPAPEVEFPEDSHGPLSAGVPATERPQGAVLLERARILPSKTNPRKTFRKLEELAESIKAHGILQPLVVRPFEQYFELVFGERRLRAAELAGLELVPALVREMSDLEVLEVQIVENVQREDVDALEEADGYRLLHEKHGYHVNDIAAKIGKSVAYVYARLKLCALGPEARQALAEGKLTDSTALLVARIPLALQKDAVKELRPREVWREGVPDSELDPVGAREAFARIQDKFMLRLVEAPFDTKDAQLVPAAGACGTCTKRTGTQPELFPDVRAADTCTDPDCFATKRDAAWGRQKAAAKAAGAVVVEGKKAKEFFPYGNYLAHTSGMVELDAEDYGDPKHRTHRQVVGKRLEEAALPVTIVRTDDGKVRELVPAKDLKKLLPKAKAKSADERPAAPTLSPAEKLTRDAKDSATTAAIAAAVRKVEAKEFTRGLWRILVTNQFREACGVLDHVLVGRKIIEEGMTDDAEIDRRVDVALSRFDADALRGLFFEGCLRQLTSYRRTEADVLTQVCLELKIDEKQLVAKELARLKAQTKTPVEAPKSKAPAKVPLAAALKAPAKKKTKAKKK